MSVEAQKRFSEDIDKLIDYYSKEFHLTYAECVGVLTMVCFDLSAEARNDNEGGEEDGEYIEEGD